MKRIAISLAFCLQINNVFAGCDPCIQAAAQTTSTQMSTSIQNVTASVQGNVSATQALNASIQATDAAWQAVVNLNSTNYLQGLDAATSRIELSQSQLLKVIENLADHEVQSITKIFEQLYNAEQKSVTERMLRPELAQPMSGEIGANRAALLKKGIVQKDQRWKQMDINFAQWSNNTATVDSAGNSITTSMLLTEDPEVFDPTPLLTKNVISEDESLNMQKLITLLANPVPEKRISDDELVTNPNAEKLELERKLRNSKRAIAFSVLSKGIAEREAVIPISEDDWLLGYTIASPDNNGNTSYRDFLESETVGRLSSEGWYQDIKTKTETGVVREQVYQQALNNHLLFKSLQQEEQQLLLLAILAAEENNKKEQ